MKHTTIFPLVLSLTTFPAWGQDEPSTAGLSGSELLALDIHVTRRPSRRAARKRASA